MKKTKSKSARKTRNVEVQPGKAFTPPKGFKVINAGANNMAPFHDFNSEPILQGKLIEIKEIKRKKVKKGQNPNQTIGIFQTDAGLRAVGASYQLDIANWKKGRNYYIEFKGKKNIGGGQTLKEFNVAEGGK